MNDAPSRCVIHVRIRCAFEAAAAAVVAGERCEDFLPAEAVLFELEEDDDNARRLVAGLFPLKPGDWVGVRRPSSSIESNPLFAACREGRRV